MNHHVLYFRKMKFDMVMYAFCNLVRFREGAVWITGNLYVYIDFVSELAGAELINTKDAFLSFNTVADHLFITIEVPNISAPVRSFVTSRLSNATGLSVSAMETTVCSDKPV